MEESNTDTTGLSGSGHSGGVRRPSYGDNVGADEKVGEYGGISHCSILPLKLE